MTSFATKSYIKTGKFTILVNFKEFIELLNYIFDKMQKLNLLCLVVLFLSVMAIERKSNVLSKSGVPIGSFGGGRLQADDDWDDHDGGGHGGGGHGGGFGGGGFGGGGHGGHGGHHFEKKGSYEKKEWKESGSKHKKWKKGGFKKEEWEKHDGGHHGGHFGGYHGYHGH